MVEEGMIKEVLDNIYSVDVIQATNKFIIISLHGQRLLAGCFIITPIVDKARGKKAGSFE